MSSILVVDDEIAILDSLRVLLREEGYAVTTAVNGREALVAIDRERFDLVLLDVMMPAFGGDETFRAIRAHLNGSGVPVVMMTAAAHRSILDPEIDAFLRKPFDLDELLDVIAQLLARH
jgi:two-component system response regulator MprA